MAVTETQLDSLVKKTQEKTWTPSEDELAVLVGAFLPSHPSGLWSKAYIALSAACQKLRESNPSSKASPDASTDAVVRPFAAAVSAKLSDTSETEVLTGVSFLTALFQVDWNAASTILQRDGILECIMDSVDLFQSSAAHALAVAQLISQAAGHKACRALIPSEGITWLENKARHAKDMDVRAAAAVALVKLSQGGSLDAAGIPVAEKPAVPSIDQDLVKMMKGLVVSGYKTSSLADSVEGLAYMSVDPSVKEQLSKDTQFLKQLFALVPKRKGAAADELGPSPVYGVAVIVMNLCAYRPRLTEEEAQIVKLRRMASTANKSSEPDQNPLEDDEHAKERGRRLVQAGALDALTAAVRASDSRATRLAVGKALLSLVEDQEGRGKVLQAGCARALVTIIQGLLPATSTSKDEQIPPLDRTELECIQALAKLAITASPIQVFGPNEGAHYDAIRPFTILLVHPTSTLLQRFEAIMALTNLASQSPEVAGRIASAPNLMNKVELLMLEDHTLVRRAATELVCNLIAGSEDVFDKYGGRQSGSAKSKLHVLLALCDVDDLATRLAASGALAMLTGSPDACQLLLELERDNHRALPILGQLIDPSIRVPREGGDQEEEDEATPPDPGLVHRGVASVRNLIAGVDEAARKELGTRAQEIGLVQALVQVFRAGSSNPSNPVLRPAAEAIKLLLDSGITLT